MQTPNDTIAISDNNTPSNTNITPSPPLSNFAKRPKRKKFYRIKRTNQPYIYCNKKQKSTVQLPVYPTESPNKELDYDEETYDDVLISEQNESLFEGISTLRLVIAYYYRCVLRAPAESLWDGTDGTISVIRNSFKLSYKHKRLIRRVLC